MLRILAHLWWKRLMPSVLSRIVDCTSIFIYFYSISMSSLYVTRPLHKDCVYEKYALHIFTAVHILKVSLMCFSLINISFTIRNLSNKKALFMSLLFCSIYLTLWFNVIIYFIFFLNIILVQYLVYIYTNNSCRILLKYTQMCFSDIQHLGYTVLYKKPKQNILNVTRRIVSVSCWSK